MRSNNRKVEGNAFILKTIYEHARYLDVFCYKGIFTSAHAESK